MKTDFIKFSKRNFNIFLVKNQCQGILESKKKEGKKMHSFTIYEEYMDLITLLKEKEQQELILAICKYMFYDKELNLNEDQMKIFKYLKKSLDKSKNRIKKVKC